MVMYFGINHAKEEICHLNIEIHHLLTFLYDDYDDHYCTVTTHIIINSPLASEISAQWSYRERIHEAIVKRLVQTSQLPGFSGNLFHGQQLGHDPARNENIPPPSWVTNLLGITSVEVEYEEPSTTTEDMWEPQEVDMDIFVEFLKDLAIC